MPRVSIGMPVYNGENYIREAIDSILAQEFTDFELIISDNASTDGTEAICRDYAARDARVRYIRQPENKGAAQNYNVLVHEARGEFFKWAAHDDCLRPGFLARCVEAFDGYAVKPAIVYTRSDLIDEQGNVIRLDPDRQQTHADTALRRAFEVLQTMSYAASVFGLFHLPTLRRTQLIGAFISSDYVLLLQCALLGKIVQLDGAPEFLRRVHPKMSRENNTSKADVLRWFDPRAKSKLSEFQRLFLEYVRAPYRMDGVRWRAFYAAAIAASVSFKWGRVALGRWRRQIGLGGRGEPAGAA
ncbi:MAG: glycosyltransferase [Pseudomonadota bacterium]